MANFRENYGGGKVMENKKMSQFLQIAYKNNRVKELSEAFQEYNPKEEVHQGNTEVFLKERVETYNLYQKCGCITRKLWNVNIF